MQFIVKEMPVAIVVVLAVRRLLFSMLEFWLKIVDSLVE